MGDFEFIKFQDLISRPKRSGVVEYNFIQDGQECRCECCGGEPAELPDLQWNILFLIDSSACIDRKIFKINIFYPVDLDGAVSNNLSPRKNPA